MKQKVKLEALQYAQAGLAAQRTQERALNAHGRSEENYLAKNRKYNNGLPGATPTEALLEELRKLYGESGAQRDVFGRRIALPSEIARALNNNRRK